MSTQLQSSHVSPQPSKMLRQSVSSFIQTARQLQKYRKRKGLSQTLLNQFHSDSRSYGLENANQQYILNQQIQIRVKRLEQAEEGLNIKKNTFVKCIHELKRKKQELNTDLENQKKQFKSLAESSYKKGLPPDYLKNLPHFMPSDDLSMSFFDNVQLHDPKNDEELKGKKLDGRKMNYLQNLFLVVAYIQRDFGVQLRFKNHGTDPLFSQHDSDKYIQVMISDDYGKKLDAVMMALRGAPSRLDRDEQKLHDLTEVKFMKMKSKDEATYNAVAKIVRQLPPGSSLIHFLYQVREHLLEKNRYSLNP